MLSRKIKRYIIRCCLVFLLLLIGAGLWIAYQAVSISIQAERTYHCVNYAIRAVNAFLEKEGKWPMSWKELENISSATPTMPTWIDWEEMQDVVSIDFQADPQLLAKQNVENFHAIKPIGPCYGNGSENETRALLATLREKWGTSETHDLHDSK
jgi:hypothetical protein